MSVRANSDGDLLSVAASLGLSTGDFSLGVWVNLDSDLGAFSDIAGFGDTTTDPVAFCALATGADGTTPHLYTNAPASTDLDSGVSMTVGTWYWLVASRSGSTIRLRVFDDSTSTTPLGNVTDTDGTDFSASDNFVLGAQFTGENLRAQLTAARVHIGVAWTDAQARAESQSYTAVTGGGTLFGNWQLQDTDADSTGINDSGGAGNNLTNTGFANGATTPSQLASGFTGTGSMAVTAALAGTGSVSIAGAGSLAITAPAEAATGTVLNPVTGTGSIALTGIAYAFGDAFAFPIPGMAGTGQQQHTGTGDLAISVSLQGGQGFFAQTDDTEVPMPAMSGTGQQSHSGTGDVAVSASLSGSGTSGSEPETGSISRGGAGPGRGRSRRSVHVGQPYDWEREREKVEAVQVQHEEPTREPRVGKPKKLEPVEVATPWLAPRGPLVVPPSQPVDRLLGIPVPDDDDDEEALLLLLSSL